MIMKYEARTQDQNAPRFWPCGQPIENKEDRRKTSELVREENHYWLIKAAAGFGEAIGVFVHNLNYVASGSPASVLSMARSSRRPR